MNKLLAILLFLPVLALAQPNPPRPATQAEVNAGTLHQVFVAPDTLSGFSLQNPTNGLSPAQGTNLINALVKPDGVTTSAVTNNGVVILSASPTNTSFFGYNTNILVLTGFGAGLVTVTNDGIGDYINGPTVNASTANSTYYWNNTTKSYTNPSNGYGVWDSSSTGVPAVWLTNSTYKFTLTAGAGSGVAVLSSVGGSYQSNPNNGWSQGDLSSVYPGAFSDFSIGGIANSNALAFSYVPYFGTGSNQPSVQLNPYIQLPQLGNSNNYNGQFVGNLAGSSNLNVSALSSTSVATNSAQSLTNGPLGAWQNNFQRVPPLMMNNLNRYGVTMTEAQFLPEVVQLAAWRTNGWKLIEVDEGWETNQNGGTLTWRTDRYPDGMPAVVSIVHTNQLRIMLYTSMSATACAGSPGTPISRAYADTAAILSWGCDGWKLDRCFGGLGNTANYVQWLDAMQQAVNDNWLTVKSSISTSALAPYWFVQFPGVDNYTTTFTPPGLMSGAQMLEVVWWGNASKTSDELWLKAHSVQRFNSLVSPGHYTGPINFDIYGTWGSNGYVSNYVNCACMLCVPLLLDSALSAATFVPSWMANSELWAIHQNPLVIPASIIWTNGSTTTPQEVWSRPLDSYNRTRAVMLWNSNTTPQSITVNSGMFNDQPNTVYYLRDVWNNANAGVFTNSFSFTVQPTNTLLLKVTAKEQYEFQGTSGIATSGLVYTTNYSSGIWYTNPYSTPITVTATTSQNAAGSSQGETDLWIPGSWTNAFAILDSPNTTLTFSGVLTGIVPVGAGFTFTNTTYASGGGAQSTLSPVQVWVH